MTGTDMSTDRRTDTGQASTQSLWVPASLRPLEVASAPEPRVEPTPAEPSADTRPRRERTPRPWDTWPANVRAAVLGTGGVMVACWVVSFDAIVAGAQAASIPFLFALLCPFIVDGQMAIGTLALVSIARRVRWWTRVYLGLLILASIGVSMAANMAGPYTRTHLLPTPWSYYAAGVPSLWLAFLVHQLVILWRHAQRPEVDMSSAANGYGVRSADGQWWWDGGQWRPVTPPVIEAATEPTVSTDTPPAPSGPPAADMSGQSAVDVNVSTDKPPTDTVPERVAALTAYLRVQADAGRTPADVGVSELSKATGIPRPTVYRLLSDALSTFRDAPGGTGRGVAAA